MSSEQSAERDFRNIAKRADLKHQESSVFQEVKTWLANLSEEWLLILDNADDPRLDTSQYLPPGDRGKILITTKNCTIWNHAANATYELEGMDLEDASSLLLTEYAAASPRNADLREEREMVEQVVNLLGCLPLAIRHTAAVISQCGYTLEYYCQIFEHDRKRLLEDRPYQKSGERTIFLTYGISLRTIREIGGDAADCAVRLLETFSFFHRDSISERIFRLAFDRSRSASDLHQLELYQNCRRGDPYSGAIRTAARLLSAFSLIKFPTRDEFISIHPLVHAWARDRMSQSEKELAWEKAHLILSTCIPWESVDLQFRQHLIPHIVECLRHFRKIHRSQVYESTHQEEAESFALVFRENGMSREARDIMEKVVEMRKRDISTRQPHTLESTHQARELQMLKSMHNLGKILYEDGATEQAQKTMEKAVAGRAERLGEDNLDTIASKRELAVIIARQPRTDNGHRGLRLTEQVLAVRRNALGEEHPLTMEAKSDLTYRYYSVGRKEAALKLREEILKFTREKRGENHPDTLKAWNDLTGIYFDLGQERKAIQVSKKVVKMTERMLYVDHSQRLDALLCLASRYYQTRQYQKAIPLYEKCVEGCRRKYGIGHYSTLDRMADLANTHWWLGKSKNIERHKINAINIWEEIIEAGVKIEDKELVIYAKASIAELYCGFNRREEGLALWREVVALGEGLTTEKAQWWDGAAEHQFWKNPFVFAKASLERELRNPSNQESPRHGRTPRGSSEQGAADTAESPRMSSCCCSLLSCKAYHRHRAARGPRADLQDRANRRAEQGRPPRREGRSRVTPPSTPSRPRGARPLISDENAGQIGAIDISRSNSGINSSTSNSDF